MIFCPLDPDPWIRIFLRIRIRIQEAKILRIQRIRILSTGLYFYHQVPSFAYLLNILLFQPHSDDFPRRWCQSTLCTIRLRAWTEYIQVHVVIFLLLVYIQAPVFLYVRTRTRDLEIRVVIFLQSDYEYIQNT